MPTMLSDEPVLPDYIPTLPNLIADCVTRFASRDMVGDSRGAYSYACVDARSREFARRLVALGAGKGSRIGLLMPNSLDWVIAFFAIGRIGAICFPVSTLFQPKELAWIARKADLQILLACSAYAEHDYVARLENGLPGLMEQEGNSISLDSHPFLRKIVVFGGTEPSWAEAPLAAKGEAAFKGGVDITDGMLSQIESEVTPADLLIGICTSGSMAEPKIVMHTHGSAIRTTHAYRPYMDVRPQDRHYCGMPLFWIAGLNASFFSILCEGACVVFSDSPKPADVISVMQYQRVTTTRLWLPQKIPLTQWIAGNDVQLPHVRRGLFTPAAGSTPPGHRMTSVLGMTECFGPHSVGDQEKAVPEHLAGYWGHELRGVERIIVDPVSGEIITDGRVGELHIRGFSMMDGYYKQERTEVFEPDGWFRTGDMCRITSEGALYFEGRNTEMIKTSGANVSPREVEIALQRLRPVQEAFVFGIPDAIKGEVVAAAVVLAEGGSLAVQPIIDALRAEVSVYKIPAHIIAISEADVPRTGSGKAIKSRLREMLLATLSSHTKST